MRPVILAAALLAAAPAAAQSTGGLRELCTERPGLGTPACTVDKGHLQVELGLGDWTLDRSQGTRTDTVLTGVTELRLGVTDSTEARVEWTAYGHLRERDGDGVQRRGGTGDVTLSVKQNLHDPDGHGFSIAMVPFATLPTGGRAIGAGTWGAGLIVPVTQDVSQSLQLEFTPEIQALPDEDGHGRHLAYSGVFGLLAKLSDKVQTSLEVQPIRDRDPGGHQTQLLGALSFAYIPHERVQFDAGAVAGLNHQSPDIELFFGLSKKF